MKYLVTGTKGFIGGTLADRFEKENMDYVGVDLDEMDIMSSYRYYDFDQVFHIGAMAGFLECEENRNLAYIQNVLSTLLLYERAKKIGAKFIFISSIAANKTDTVYGNTKRLCEDILLSKPNVQIIRLSNVYGPGSQNKNSVVAKMCKDAILIGKIHVNGSGHQRRSFIYINEVVENLRNCEVLPCNLITSYINKESTTINDLAYHVKSLSKADIEWHPSSEKTEWNGDILHPTVLHTNWKEGVERTFLWFKEYFQKSGELQC